VDAPARKRVPIPAPKSRDGATPPAEKRARDAERRGPANADRKAPANGGGRDGRARRDQGNGGVMQIPNGAMAVIFLLASCYCNLLFVLLELRATGSAAAT